MERGGSEPDREGLLHTFLPLTHSPPSLFPMSALHVTYLHVISRAAAEAEVRK